MESLKDIVRTASSKVDSDLRMLQFPFHRDKVLILNLVLGFPEIQKPFYTESIIIADKKVMINLKNGTNKESKNVVKEFMREFEILYKKYLKEA